MKFSICIPNYNYEKFVVETVNSLLGQGAEIEVIVCDNDSSDGSVAAVTAIGDDRVRIRRNAWNVGFAGNLDRACEGATGDRMILLSSDDLAVPDALGSYAVIADFLGDASGQAVFASDQFVIDENGDKTGQSSRDRRLWHDAKKHEGLSERLGVPVVHIAAKDLLRQSLLHLRTPFAFATTCYPRALYEAVEGYGGGYLFNPDKAFAWKLLTVATDVYYVEKPLFSYRVHGQNQAAQQQQSGALKHLMDQYRATFDVAPETLNVAGLERRDLAKAFIEHDIVLRGLRQVAEGKRALARRGLDFGRAAYPDLVASSARAKALGLALTLGPFGTWVAKRFYDKALERYRQGGVTGERS